MADPAPDDAPIELRDALPSLSIATAERQPNRQAAIRRSGDLLVAGGSVDAAYTDEMLAAVEEYGPYIVIAPGVALAHARPSGAVHGVAFSVLTLDPPIPFGHEENDPVRLVIGMAAPDADVHVEALRQLAELLDDEERRARLMAASSVEEVEAVVAG